MYTCAYLAMLADIKRKNIQRKMSQFYEDHRGTINECLFLGGIGASLTLLTIVPRAYSQRVADTSFFDLETGLVWRSTRPLTKAEKLRVEALVVNGVCGIGSALNRLGILAK